MLRFRVAYIAAFVISLVVFIGVGTPLALSFLVLLILMFVVAVVMPTLMEAHTRFSFVLKPGCQVGQDLDLSIEVERPRFLPTGRMDGELVCRNTMRGESFTVPLELSATRLGKARFSLPLDTDACGKFDISIDGLWLYDPFALFRRRKHIGFSASYTVYPQLIDLMVVLERAPRSASAGITYDPHRRGQDKTETFEIRDYQITDSLRSVHWKLSTKLDRMVVREASHPSNYDILVLVDMGNRFARTNARVSDAVLVGVLDLTASIRFDLRRRGLGHNIALRDGDHVADFMVDTPMSYSSALDLLVSTPIADTMGVDVNLFEWYCREHAFTKTIVITADMNQAAFTEMARMVDLSVIYAADVGETAVDESTTYSLIGIPVDDLRTSVRNVVI